MPCYQPMVGILCAFVLASSADQRKSGYVKERPNLFLESGMVGNSSIQDKQALKEKYLGCFGVRAANATAMQDTVKGLVQIGITRKTLHEWAVGAGFSAGYVRSLLSKTFCALGMRERAVGAGRKPPPDALELLVYARARYGDRFLKVLRAALRAGKARFAAEGLRSGSPSDSATVLIVAPQLEES